MIMEVELVSDRILTMMKPDLWWTRQKVKSQSL